MGHVFHPGHDALHGVTVVVRGKSGRHYVGRYHETTERGVVLHDVGIHGADSPEPVDAWVARQLKFGIRIDERFLVVATAEAASITRLTEWEDKRA